MNEGHQRPSSSTSSRRQVNGSSRTPSIPSSSPHAWTGWWSSPDPPSINPKGMSTESEWIIPLDTIFLSRHPHANTSSSSSSPHHHPQPHPQTYFFSIATQPASSQHRGEGDTSIYPGVVHRGGTTPPSSADGVSISGSGGCVACGVQRAIIATGMDTERSPHRAFGTSLLLPTGGEKGGGPSSNSKPPNTIPPHNKVTSNNNVANNSYTRESHSESSEILKKPKKKKSGGGWGSLLSCCSSSSSYVKESRRSSIIDGSRVALPIAVNNLDDGSMPLPNGFPLTSVERSFSMGFRSSNNCDRDDDESPTNVNSSFSSASYNNDIRRHHQQQQRLPSPPLVGILPPTLLHNAAVRDSLSAAMVNSDAWGALLDRSMVRLLATSNVSPANQYWSKHNFAALASGDLRRTTPSHTPVLSQTFSLGGGKVMGDRSKQYNDALDMQCILGRSRLLPPLESVQMYLSSLSPQARAQLPELFLGAIKGASLDSSPPREPIGTLNLTSHDGDHPSHPHSSSTNTITPSDHALNLLSILDMAFNSSEQLGGGGESRSSSGYTSPMTVRREMLSVLLSVVRAPNALPHTHDDDATGGTIMKHAEELYTAMFGKYEASDDDEDERTAAPSSNGGSTSSSHNPRATNSTSTSSTHRVVVPPSPSLWERQCCYSIEMLGGTPTTTKQQQPAPGRRRVAEAFINTHKPTIGFLNFMPLSEALSKYVVAVPDPSNPNIQILCLKFRISVFVAFSDEVQGAIHRICAMRALPRYGLRGLKNHGATCYLNVVLQVFYHSRYLRREGDEGHKDLWGALSDMKEQQHKKSNSAVVVPTTPSVDSTDLPPGAVDSLVTIFEGLAGGRDGESASSSPVVVTKPLLRSLGISASVQFDAHEALSEFFLNGFFRHVAESLFAWPVDNVTQGLSDPAITSSQRDILYEFSVCVQGMPTLEDAFRMEFRGVPKSSVQQGAHLWTTLSSSAATPNSDLKEDRKASLKRWGFGEDDVLEYVAQNGKRVPAVRFVRLPIAGGTRGVVTAPSSPLPRSPRLLSNRQHLPPLFSPSCTPKNLSNVNISDIQFDVETPPRNPNREDGAAAMSAARGASPHLVTPQRPPVLPMFQASDSLRQQRHDNPPMIIVHTKRFDMYARKVHATQRYPLVLTWKFLLSLATDPNAEPSAPPPSATTPARGGNGDVPSIAVTTPPPTEQQPNDRFAPTESVRRAAPGGRSVSDHQHGGKAGLSNQFSFTLGSTGRGGGLSSTLRQGPGLEDDQDYVLYGVVAHHGTSMESGHYTCYLRFATDEDRASSAPTEQDTTGNGVTFFHFDDEAVYPVSAATMLKGISGAFWECPGTSAYLLFYVRRAEWLTM